MSRLQPLLIATFALGMAAFVTGPKLFHMFQIRGWIAGRTLSTEVVLQKWHEKTDKRDAWWIGWGPEPVQQVSSNRINIEEKDWKRYRIFDHIDIVRIPGSRWPYALKNDIWVSRGNFAFDFALLAIELAFGLTAVRKLSRASSATA
jgi:hypothetical protein